MAWDRDREVAVLFGGWDPEGLCSDDDCGDTWEWDGRSWHQRQPALAPAGRLWPSLAYDAARRAVVLFGGGAAAPGVCGERQLCSDTWLWDGQRWERAAAPVGPAGRYGASMAYDPRGRRVTLFGGMGFTTACGGGGQYCADTWEWDGHSWTRREPVSAPTERYLGAMAWDAGRGVLVLFGGTCLDEELGQCSDLWEWDGEAWTRRDLPSGPVPTNGAAAAYDEGRGFVVLAGGRDPYGGTDPAGAATWEWDGSGWTRREVAVAPPGRFDHALAWDPERGRAVMFGGCGERGTGDPPCGAVRDDLWEWDEAGWSRADPAYRPDARYEHAMARAPAGAGVLLFGGRDLHGRRRDDTWTWDGEAWTRHRPLLAPAPRSDHALAYDAGRDVVVLFGGTASELGVCGTPGQADCSDLWEWDGGRWTRRPLPASPPALHGHALVYDRARRRTVLLGGTSGQRADPTREKFLTVWEWDGERWEQAEPLPAAPERTDHAAAFDAGRGEAVLVGGDGGCTAADGSRCPETWIWAPQRYRPRLLAGFDVRGAALPSAADPSTKEVLGATLRARAGGLGHTWAGGRGHGLAVPGFAASVSVFGHGGWLRLSALAGAAPEAMRDWTASFDRGWSCGEPWCAEATVDRWVGADGRLWLDLAPLASAGDSPEPGRIAVDYVELRLRLWRTGCEAPTVLRPDGTPDGTPCTDGLPETAGETCLGYECVAP